jgi:hypothetical protein
LKPTTRQIFRTGNYIANILDQIPNNILLFDTYDYNETNCITTICSNVVGISDCEFENFGATKKKQHSTFLVKISGDSMINAGISDGDVLLVDSSTQAVNNSIVLAEINNCMCIKKIKYIADSFVLFSENNDYPPIPVKKTDNCVIWGVVISTLDTM